jgi:hypothetical protein
VQGIPWHSRGALVIEEGGFEHTDDGGGVLIVDGLLECKLGFPGGGQGGKLVDGL